MEHTTLESLERRVAALEKGLADMLKPEQNIDHWKDWRRAISGVERTDLAEEVDAAAREIREADRRQTS
jgi:hypothetical protein